MLIHATTTSERGKPTYKSGNEYLEIEIKNENRQNILELKIQRNEDKTYSIRGYAIYNREDQLKAESYIKYEAR